MVSPTPQPVPSLHDGSEGRTETRDRILREAAACFARYGVARTRLEDVASAAGVSRALVHSYFGAKGKLLRRVQEQVLEDWFAAAEQVVQEATGPEAALAAWLGFSLRSSDRHQVARAIFTAHDGSVARGEAFRTRLRQEWLGRLEQLLERGRDDGVFRADLDVPATAAALRGLQIGLTQQLFGEDLPVPAARQIEAGIELMLAGLRPVPKQSR